MSRSIQYKEKSKKELEALNTYNLLAYYKAERQRFYRFEGSCKCHCGCGEMAWEVNHGYKKEKEKYNQWGDYLSKIRSVLNKREDVVNVKKYNNL